MKSNPEEKETVLEQHEIPNEVVEVHPLKECRSERTASQDAMEADTEKTDPDPGMMQSTVVHQEFSKNDAAVIPVKGRKKRRRARKPAAGRCGEPNELTRSDCGSGKHLAAACKKITRRATVAWRKRKVLRRIGTQEICEQRSKLTAAGIKVTHHAGVAWPREKFVRKDCTRNKTKQKTQTRRNNGKRLRKGLVCNNGLRNQRLSTQQRGKTGIKDPRTRQ
jgi:hypothetical protein